MRGLGLWPCMHILPTRIHNKRVALARKEKRGCVTHPFTFGRIRRRRVLHAHRGRQRDAYPPTQESPCKLPSSSLPLSYTQQYTEKQRTEKPLTFFGLIVKLSIPELQILAFLCFERCPGAHTMTLGHFGYILALPGHSNHHFYHLGFGLIKLQGFCGKN